MSDIVKFMEDARLKLERRDELINILKIPEQLLTRADRMSIPDEGRSIDRAKRERKQRIEQLEAEIEKEK